MLDVVEVVNEVFGVMNALIGIEIKSSWMMVLCLIPFHHLNHQGKLRFYQLHMHIITHFAKLLGANLILAQPQTYYVCNTCPLS